MFKILKTSNLSGEIEIEELNGEFTEEDGFIKLDILFKTLKSSIVEADVSIFSCVISIDYGDETFTEYELTEI